MITETCDHHKLFAYKVFASEDFEHVEVPSRVGEGKIRDWGGCGV